MKYKPIFSLLFILAFSFFSCQKESLEITEQNTSVVDKFSKLLPSDRRVAFSLLTPLEKVTIWKTRLEGAIESNNLSAEQIRMLEEFTQLLSVEFFDKKYTIREESQTDELFLKSLKLFNAKFIYHLLFTLDDDRLEEAALIEKVATLSSCMCNLASGCFRIGGTWGIETGACEAPKPCKEAESGCGVFFRYACNGSNCDFGGG